MFRIAICEDDVEQSYLTREEVVRLLDPGITEIDLFMDGAELVAAVEQGTYTPDIAILDINMPEMSGIEVAKQLNEYCSGCRIIFLTSYLGYATDVYDTNHSYFVLKSQLCERLKSAFEKVFRDIDREAYVTFKADGEQWKLPTEGVMYLERSLRKVRIVCRRRSFVTATKLEEILEGVNDGKFVHCHQSYWVNPAYIRSMTADSYIMVDETVIPISRANRTLAKDAFFRYIHSKME